MHKGLSSHAHRLLLTSSQRTSRRLITITPRRRQPNGGYVEPTTGLAQIPGGFPWREAPPKSRGIFNLLWHNLQQETHRKTLEYLLKEAMDESLESYTENAIIPGSTQAFATCTDAIFQKRHKTTVKAADSSSTSADAADAEPKPVTDSNNADLPEEGKQTESEAIPAQGAELQPVREETIDPKDVMGDALADFYMEAMAAASCSSQDVFYSFDTIVDANMGDISVTRRYTKDDGTEVSVTIDKSEFEEVGQGEGQMTVYDLKLEVEFVCREVFFVKDSKTDVILQGSEAMANINHRLTLESTLSSTLPSDVADFVKKIQDDFNNKTEGQKTMSEVFEAFRAIPERFPNVSMVWEGPEWKVTNIDDWINDSPTSSIEQSE